MQIRKKLQHQFVYLNENIISCDKTVSPFIVVYEKRFYTEKKRVMI